MSLQKYKKKISFFLDVNVGKIIRITDCACGCQVSS